MQWKLHVVVAAVVEQAGRYLLVEEHAGRRIVYNQPAGHVEAGESLLEAVIRETREETGWRFHPAAFLGLYRWVNADNVTYLRFCFTGQCDNYDPGQSLDEGILRIHWLTYEEIEASTERLRSPLVLRCIRDYRAGKRYPLELYADLAVGMP